MRILLFALLLLLSGPVPVLAQSQADFGAGATSGAGGAFDAKKFVRRPMDGQKPVIYEDTLSSDKRKAKKKKIPKKTFWGIKTRKAYTKQKSGRKVTYELFYILKKPQDPDPYIRDLYWFHRKKKKITVGPIPPREKQYAVLLHGPYEKRVNKIVVEQGQFFVGTKTGRWETVTNNDDEILIDKQKFYKGLPKDAEVTYYDADKIKIEEVKPIVNGQLTGVYQKFYKSGALAEEGKYENGIKIGVWKEYYENKKRLKVEWQHAPDGFTQNFEPVKLRELDEKGTITYDKTLADKKK